METRKEEAIVRTPASDLACVHFAAKVDACSTQVLFKSKSVSLILNNVDRCLRL